MIIYRINITILFVAVLFRSNTKIIFSVACAVYVPEIEPPCCFSISWGLKYIKEKLESYLQIKTNHKNNSLLQHEYGNMT